MVSVLSNFNNIVLKSFYLGALFLCTCDTHAADPVSTKELAKTLPNIPSTTDQPARFDLNNQGAAFDYGTKMEKWRAEVSPYSDVNHSVTLDYGTLLTNDFGAGMSVTRGAKYSEAVVNSVYALQRDLRVKVTGGQLRTTLADYSPDYASKGVLQNNYMLDVRKYWGRNEPLSDIGLTAYAVEANGLGHGNSSLLNGETNMAKTDAGSSELVLGNKEGYMLNLGVQPNEQSRIELRRELNYLKYYLDRNVQSQDSQSSTGINYSQYFDNCARLSGGYSTADNTAGSLNLKLAQNNWSINVSRSQGNNGKDTAVQIGYTIPLGKWQQTDRNCGNNLSAPTFTPMVDSTIKRPDQFPREPVAKQISE